MSLTIKYFSSKEEVGMGYGTHLGMMTTKHKPQAIILEYVLMQLGLQ
jgi:hypothetical protein